MFSRLDEARKVAISLLDTLENTTSPIDRILMKTKRLARLMRDSDAQYWLNLESKGYPEGFSASKLGTCLKYVLSSGRVNRKTSKYYIHSLPAIEANVESDEVLISSLKTSKPISSNAKDFIEKNATEALMATKLKLQAKQIESFTFIKGLYSSLRASIHDYITDTYLSIELGDIAEAIFEEARNEVDTFVRSHCPEAAEKLIAINERMQDGSSESRTAALTSCRRLLMAIADSVFPAREEDWTDASGNKRRVGSEQYKNRLLAYISESYQSEGSEAIVETELHHLADRLDAIYDKTCKGVHVDVQKQEARLAVIHTYLFIGEVANHTESTESEG
ncbi:MAG: hypothetical protein K8R76_04005 [Candidatus Aegiribacteria sp.]|nr:hypothetical protein [Candidatus Aegiribacteria sp.]